MVACVWFVNGCRSWNVILPHTSCKRSIQPSTGGMAGEAQQHDLVGTWRIIPFSKWLVTPNYKPFRPFGRGITPVRGLTNHGY